MKFTFNWGTGILVSIIIFFIAIFTFVYYSTTFRRNLVVENYYEEELKYQEHIDKVHNTDNLESKLNINQSQRTLKISVPDSLLKMGVDGKILLYKPSDNREDKIYKLKPDKKGIQTIALGNLLNGRYIIKIDWICDSIPYYQEKSIFIE